jgi:hypothetical protein
LLQMPLCLRFHYQPDVTSDEAGRQAGRQADKQDDREAGWNDSAPQYMPAGSATQLPQDTAECIRRVGGGPAGSGAASRIQHQKTVSRMMAAASNSMTSLDVTAAVVNNNGVI